MRLRILVTAVLSLGLIALPSAGLASTRRVSSTQLRSKLLKLNQLPAGWNSVSIPTNGVGCLANLIEPKGSDATAVSQREFAAGQGIPDVVERLAVYPNPTAIYKEIVRHLDACNALTGRIDGASVTGTVKPIALGEFGTASSAFNASFTSEGTAYGDDVFVARHGNVILGIDEGDLAPISTSQFRGIASSASKKLLGHH